MRAVRGARRRVRNGREHAKIDRPYRGHDETPYKNRQGPFAQRAPGIGWFLNLDAIDVSLDAGFFGDVSATKAYRAAVEAPEADIELEGTVGDLASA